MLKRARFKPSHAADLLIEALWDDGVKVGAIAKAVGCSESYASRRARQLGGAKRHNNPYRSYTAQATEKRGLA